MQLRDILPQLKEWFPPEAHKERDLPGGGKWWYVPWQVIRDRLEDIAPGEWQVSYGDPGFLDDLCHITCTLTICGCSRQGVGSAPIRLMSRSGKDMSRGNAIERAVADAFKNAAEQFGVCAYLDEQVDDATKRKFAMYLRNGAGNGAAVAQQLENEGRLRKAKPTPAKPFGQPQPDMEAIRTVTEAQLKRLFAISRSAGWRKEAIKFLLDRKYGIQSTRELNAAQYEEICGILQDVENAQAWNEFAASRQQESS